MNYWSLIAVADWRLCLYCLLGVIGLYLGSIKWHRGAQSVLFSYERKWLSLFVLLLIVHAYWGYFYGPKSSDARFAITLALGFVLLIVIWRCCRTTLLDVYEKAKTEYKELTDVLAALKTLIVLQNLSGENVDTIRVKADTGAILYKRLSKRYPQLNSRSAEKWHPLFPKDGKYPLSVAAAGAANVFVRTQLPALIGEASKVIQLCANMLDQVQPSAEAALYLNQLVHQDKTTLSAELQACRQQVHILTRQLGDQQTIINGNYAKIRELERVESIVSELRRTLAGYEQAWKVPESIAEQAIARCDEARTERMQRLLFEISALEQSLQAKEDNQTRQAVAIERLETNCNRLTEEVTAITQKWTESLLLYSGAALEFFKYKHGRHIDHASIKELDGVTVIAVKQDPEGPRFFEDQWCGIPVWVSSQET
jgi:hypothetical protein